jgi:hypothetical protein
MQRQRLQTLKRLVALYGVVEEMESLGLQRTTAAVYEAEEAMSVQQLMAQSARLSGRDALSVGDRMGWTVSEIQRESSGWKRRRLEQVRSEREVLRDASREQYMASRLKSEQMKRVTESLAAQERFEEERRLQAALDDRFLARRRRSSGRDSMRGDGEMKVS